VPDGFSDQLCIFANGDMECPGGDYSEKTVLYSGADDDRRCGPCACDTPPVSTCTGTFEFYDNDDCTGSVLGTSSTAFGCGGNVTGMESIRLVFDGDGSCPVFKGASPLGEIAPAGEMTYCCTPAE
jgi:hypothetical protein